MYRCLAAPPDPVEVEQWQAGLQGHHGIEQARQPSIALAKRMDQDEFGMRLRKCLRNLPLKVDT